MFESQSVRGKRDGLVRSRYDGACEWAASDGRRAYDLGVPYAGCRVLKTEAHRVPVVRGKPGVLQAQPVDVRCVGGEDTSAVALRSVNGYSKMNEWDGRGGRPEDTQHGARNEGSGLAA